MEYRPNIQPTRELGRFQKMILQQKYIEQLNKWLDELEWENEKKDTIIQQRDAEIAAWKRDFERYQKKHKEELDKKQRKIESMGKKYTTAHNEAMIVKSDRIKILQGRYHVIAQNKEVQKLRKALSEAVAIAELLYQELQNNGIKTKIRL